MAASSAVKCALKNGVAVLHITSPPVNALGAAVRVHRWRANLQHGDAVLQRVLDGAAGGHV